MAHPAFLASASPTPDALRSPPDESRQSFLRMVSHELRTPLNSIIGFSEILSHELCGPLSPQYKEYAGLIGQSGHRLLNLVNQMLEIVRLEGGGADLELAPEPVEPIIQAAFSQMREEAESAGVRLESRVPPDLPEVVADPRALQSALVNLLQNAVAHSPPDSCVTVRAQQDSVQVRIEVQDQGKGVAPAELDRIMRPFEQAGDALTRQRQGAGLGLPITRLLCAAMGGGLTLESEPGAGLTAVIRLKHA